MEDINPLVTPQDQHCATATHLPAQEPWSEGLIVLREDPSGLSITVPCAGYRFACRRTTGESWRATRSFSRPGGTATIQRLMLGQGAAPFATMIRALLVGAYGDTTRAIELANVAVAAWRDGGPGMRRGSAAARRLLDARIAALAEVWFAYAGAIEAADQHARRRIGNWTPVPEPLWITSARIDICRRLSFGQAITRCVDLLVGELATSIANPPEPLGTASGAPP